MRIMWTHSLLIEINLYDVIHIEIIASFYIHLQHAGLILASVINVVFYMITTLLGFSDQCSVLHDYYITWLQ